MNVITKDAECIELFIRKFNKKKKKNNKYQA